MCLCEHHRESVPWGSTCVNQGPGQCDWTRQPLFESVLIFYICKYKNAKQDLEDFKLGSENPQKLESHQLTKQLAWHLVLSVWTRLIEKRVRVCWLKGQHSSDWEQVVSPTWKLPDTGLPTISDPPRKSHVASHLSCKSGWEPAIAQGVPKLECATMYPLSLVLFLEILSGFWQTFEGKW